MAQHSALNQGTERRACELKPPRYSCLPLSQREASHRCVSLQGAGEAALAGVPAVRSSL